MENPSHALAAKRARARHTLVSAPLIRLVILWCAVLSRSAEMNPNCSFTASAASRCPLLTAIGRTFRLPVCRLLPPLLIQGLPCGALNVLEFEEAAGESVFERERIETPGRFLVVVRFYLIGTNHNKFAISSIQPRDDARDGVTTLGCLSMGHPPQPPWGGYSTKPAIRVGSLRGSASPGGGGWVFLF